VAVGEGPALLQQDAAVVGQGVEIDPTVISAHEALPRWTVSSRRRFRLPARRADTRRAGPADWSRVAAGRENGRSPAGPRRGRGPGPAPPGERRAGNGPGSRSAAM